MSHFKIQHVRVLFFETFKPNSLNRFIARCVPLLLRQELLVRPGIVVVQFELAVIVPIQVEHARVAIAVSYVRHAIKATARTIGTGLYFMRDPKSQNMAHQVRFFL